MNTSDDFPDRMTQKEFAALIGRSEPMVVKHKAAGRLVMDGRLVCVRASLVKIKAHTDPGRGGDHAGKPPANAPWGAASDSGIAEIVAERARLLREQADRIALQNAITRGEYAPVGLLADVLGLASSAVVERFDQLEGMLKKVVPDLPDAAKTAVLRVIADARNTWVQETSRIVTDAVDAMVDPIEPNDSRETSPTGEPHV